MIIRCGLTRERALSCRRGYEAIRVGLLKPSLDFMLATPMYD